MFLTSCAWATCQSTDARSHGSPFWFGTGTGDRRESKAIDETTATVDRRSNARARRNEAAPTDAITVRVRPTAPSRDPSINEKSRRPWGRRLLGFVSQAEW